MNSEDLVHRLHAALVATEPQATLDYRAAPVGRRQKSAAEMQLAAWIQGLDDVSRRNVAFLLKSAADNAVFGMLCMLDGIKGEPDGGLELWHVDSSGQRCRLNGPETEMLNSIYRGAFPALMP